MMDPAVGSDRDRAPDGESGDRDSVDRRDFLWESLKATLGVPIALSVLRVSGARGAQATEEETERIYGMGIDIQKCIGCGRCAQACKAENDVPDEPYFFNTWVERYVIRSDGEVVVDSPNGGIDGFPAIEDEGATLRTFFVPKLCNHCEEAPCVQVCPVGATFITGDGAVLVDEEYCIGCGYCVQACPYGARWFDPVKHVARKCTFCYHRLSRGKVPACVEVCPTSARLFGDLGHRANPLARFLRFSEIQVLKPHLNTKPKVFYANLDGEVR